MKTIEMPRCIKYIAEEGHILTNYTGEDILEYYSTPFVYSPVDKECPFYEITLEEDAKYQADKEAAMAEPEEE